MVVRVDTDDTQQTSDDGRRKMQNTMLFIFQVPLRFCLDKSYKCIARRPEPQIGESAYPVSPIGNFGTLM